MTKLLYKPFSLMFSVLGGLVAGAIFKQIWKLVGGEEDAPDATDADRGWGEILISAALQGAIFAVVKATIDRTAAKGTQKLTGTWPGDEQK
jgi:predicted metal-dependent enzyme (double-stranded beta helix superfamily)